MANQNLRVIWTDRAYSDSSVIKEYLRYHFTEREIENYYKLLESFEKIVASFPELYPKSNKNRKMRRAVLSKQLSVFYTLNKSTIIIVAVLDNRMSDSRWP